MNSEGRLSLADERYDAAKLAEYTPEMLQEILAPVQAMRNSAGLAIPVICDPFCKHCDTDACPYGTNRAPKDKGYCAKFKLAAETAHEANTMLERQLQVLLVDVN